MRRTLTALVLLLPALALAGPARADDLVVVNGTDSAVVSLFVSEVRSRAFGPDQLDEPLAPGARIVVKDLEPGLHRVRLIDEDDNECVIDNIPVRDGATWTITDEALDECQSDEVPGKDAAIRPSRPGASKVLAAATGQSARLGVE